MNSRLKHKNWRTVWTDETGSLTLEATLHEERPYAVFYRTLDVEGYSEVEWLVGHGTLTMHNDTTGTILEEWTYSELRELVEA